MCYDPLRLCLCFLICSTCRCEEARLLQVDQAAPSPTTRLVVSLGRGAKGCCGCERATAREELELVHRYRLGRLRSVKKAAAKALCLIRRGLGIKGALRTPLFVVAPALARVSRIQAHRRACDARGERGAGWFLLGTNPACADAIRDSFYARRVSSGTQKPG